MKLSSKDYFYVTIQGVLFVAYLFEMELITFHFPAVIALIGLIITIVGVIVTTLALLQLNRNLSPFPTPKSSAQLVQYGLYKYVRHPIYSGILFITFGYGLFSASLYKLLIAVALLVLFYLKSSYEEDLLMQVYPEYGKYRRSTGRFFIKLF
ncbi:MAG: methyltransferase [Saprospiraceae bacterium]|nr:isoprenylcysteine carboxylmethyltransferase family protein [Lewinella sp.]